MESRVNSSKNWVPFSEPLLCTIASRRRPSSAPIAAFKCSNHISILDVNFITASGHEVKVDVVRNNQ